MTAPALPQIVEALLFASPEPLTTSALVRAIRAAATAATTSAKDEENEDAPAQEAAAPLPEETDPTEEEAEGGGGSDGADGADGADSAGGGEPEAGGIQVLARVSDSQVLDALAELAASYEASGRAFTLAERATGWRIFTRAEYGPWVRGLFPERRPHRLSQPALETLAIIAYRQPITKAAVEAVRGVSIDGPIQKLLDQNIIRIAGRADLPGRPLLYETTSTFFEHFGIRSVDDLPNASELRRIALPVPEAEKPSEPAAEQPELPIADNAAAPPAASEPAPPEPEAEVAVAETPPRPEAAG
jgi:segregation and condensation protein B